MEAAVSESNEIIDSGWTGAVNYIRQLTQCMLHLADDIQANHREALTALQIAKLGIGELSKWFYAEDVLAPLVNYEPMVAEADRGVNKPEFSLAGDSFAPLEDEDFKLVCETVSSKWKMLFRVVEALVAPGMPEPTIDDIGSIFVESARHFGVANIVQVAAETELTDGGFRKGSGDLFCVGKRIAAFANGLLPAHATGTEGTISIPIQPDLDTTIAACLALRLQAELRGSTFIPRHSDFNPSSSNTQKDLTIGCGIPFHDPARLCFDRRCIEGAASNTDLIVESLHRSGIDMSYAAELIQWSARSGEANCFPVQLFTKICSIAGSVPLAMNAWRLYLDSRFPVPFQEMPPEPTLALTNELQKLGGRNPIDGHASEED